MKSRKLTVFLAFGAILLLLLLSSGCGKKVNVVAGRLYYTVREVGCTRIEWTDVDGLECHHVLGALPVRDEFSDRQVNTDNNEALARDSKYVSSPFVSDDGRYMVCLYGKQPAICLYNLVTKQQEGTIKATGRFYYPSLGRDREVFYSRLNDGKRCSLYMQRYPQAPAELLRSYYIDGAAFCSVDNSVYYSEVYPDGYTMLKRCDLQGKNVTDVIEGATQPAFPRIGHELACVLSGKLLLYNLYTHDRSFVNAEIGTVSPCWNPQGNALAFVRNGAIFTVVPGQEPVQLVLKDKEIVDVFWAKGLD